MKYIYIISFVNKESISFECDTDIDFSIINDTKPLKLLDTGHGKDLWINLDNVSFIQKEAEK